MENVLTTIKESCEHLKTKKLINEEQFKLCEQLSSKQKWRDNLGSNTVTPQIDIFTQTHMNKYANYKKIVDSSFGGIVNAKNKDYYMKLLENVKKNIAKDIAEFQTYSQTNDSKRIFREYLAKQDLYSKNKNNIIKQSNNLDFIDSKHKHINENTQTENFRTLIYSGIFTICLLSIIIISIVILYYGK